ncbi:MAG: IclR family transcriptional regulator [Acidimicrobiia bacterium]
MSEAIDTDGPDAEDLDADGTGPGALDGELREKREATTIKSVERAATLLGFFTVGRPRLSLGEITERLGVSKATAHRYAVALRRVNLLRYDPATASYTLGPQALTLGSAARAGLAIISLAGPIMERLVRQFDETVVLSVWDGEAPTVVRTEDNTMRVVRISVAVGARLGTFDSAQGRVFCAFLPEGDVPGLAAELDRHPELVEELDMIRATRLAVNTPEVHGLQTLAAPVMGGDDIVAVMAVVGTAVTVRPNLDSPVAKRLSDAAVELSALLGD